MSKQTIKFVFEGKRHLIAMLPEEPDGSFGITRCGLRFPAGYGIEDKPVTCRRCRGARRAK